eukprot:scaffold2790_cov56-Phaeocystis_antarctica.AAC.3
MHSPGVERVSEALPSQEAMRQPGAEGASESVVVVLGSPCSPCALGSPCAACCAAARLDLSRGSRRHGSRQAWRAPSWRGTTER